MSHRNRCKARIVPQQNKKICGIICFCQLVLVLSCVSLIYLTVVIYIPSYRAFHSGFELRPVMCQTINTSMINNCSWASCGEWCLTKASGFCPQIHATVRQNGTNVQFKNCTSFHKSSCPPVDSNAISKFNCNNGTECASLKGVFNCSLGHCRNMSEIYNCHYKADGFTLDSDKDNVKLNGFFECKGSRCTKIKRAFSCDRICLERILSTDHNVFLNVDDSVFFANCSSAVAFNAARGNAEGYVVNATHFWNAKPEHLLMASCYSVSYDPINNLLNGTDCINGSIYSLDDVPKPSMSFKQYWNLTGKWKEIIDPKEQKFLPMQSVLTIYNHSRLYINLEGCVNTLKGECIQFLHSHGRDGKNETAQSKYPCFYNKHNNFMVIARYNLEKTRKELIIALSVPSVFFVVSFITLCIIMQSVRVDDDTRMRCKYCCTQDSDLTEMMVDSNKYELSSPESEGPLKRYDKVQN
ncbi:uncharacterized protein LOC123321641 [Coccinella septempunctata]|uniref:uncharacterized protein LOC123321641 n=1 Tax=Coccinella septempunctata TaxID=41139 RepID=UPI001D079E9F|nr:uncharacterized protein LOC123321641 [Coccinella septempunctata]